MEKDKIALLEGEACTGLQTGANKQALHFKVIEQQLSCKKTQIQGKLKMQLS